MNICVDFPTALELKEAGFEQPKPEAGQFWYLGSQLCMVCLIDLGVRVELQGVGESEKYYPGIQQLQAIGLFAPTALEIIAEMPFGTHIVKNEKDWSCWFKITEMQPDFRHDPCPHKAAAKAFLAWKKGLI